MFNKLKNKLKKWTKKVTEETPEETSEKIIEESLQKTSTELEKEIADQTIEKKERKKERKERKKLEKETKRLRKEEKKKEKILKKGKTEIDEEKIDEKLKEEVRKEKYLEPKTKFVVGLEKVEPILPEKPIQKKEITKEKKSFFKKIISSKKIITEEQFDEYAEDLEMILLENNVALEVAEKIIEELKNKITNQELDKKQIAELITKSLKEIINEVLLPPFNIIEEIKNKDSPYVMVFCGINGVGKTTQIAKIAYMLKEKGFSCVIAAGDTFRAAAIEQIKTHGEKLDIKIISHNYKADPAAVGFDAIQYAKKNKIDVVLMDTAGRMHTATNLLNEMKKIIKVTKPDRTIFVGESITGNDAVDQIRAFDETIGIDGIFLSKADIDEKGGTALSVGYITKKPIIYLGIGQNYKDLEAFDKEKFIEKLGL